MNAKRIWQVGSLLAIIAVLAAGWFLLISPLFDQVKLNESNAATVESTNESLRSQIALLQGIDQDALKADIARYEVGVPKTPSTTSLTREIKATVEATGAALTAVAYSDPSNFVAGGTGVDENAEPVTAEETSGPNTVPLPLYQADIDRVVSAGLIAINVTVNLNADQVQFLAAADALQRAPSRKLLVTGVSFTPPTASATGMGTIEAIAWVLPSEPLGQQPTA
ncbi:MAG: hypothetical protein J7484_14510 [Microbacterium sp.]|nr:hypothetical protein [Microbacterium sp.]